MHGAFVGDFEQAEALLLAQVAAQVDEAFEVIDLAGFFLGVFPVSAGVLPRSPNHIRTAKNTIAMTTTVRNHDQSNSWA